jgi:hypothetical protein
MYFHLTELVAGAPVAAKATQSFGFPGPLVTTTVIMPPGFTVVGETVIVGVDPGGACTVIAPLVASRVNSSLARNRASYVPGVEGATNCSVPLVPPPRYFHATELVSGALVDASATQSFGFPGPFATDTVIMSPGFTVVGDTVTVGEGGACTVIGPLVASRMNSSLARRRTSYVPGVTRAANCSVALVPPPMYFHTAALVSGAPVGANATQSFEFPGPLATTTVIMPPELTVVGDAVTVGIGAASSFTIVPVPAPPPRTALVGLLNATAKVSFGSHVVSPVTATAMVCVATPGAKVNIPLAAT